MFRNSQNEQNERFLNIYEIQYLTFVPSEITWH